MKTGRIGIDYSRKTKGLVFAIIDTENVGKGRPPLTVVHGHVERRPTKGGGVQVTDDPDADSPVGKAGLKKDDVIVALDGKKIADYDAMLDFMSKKKPDDVVKFTVKRDGKEQTSSRRRPTGGGGAGAGGEGGRRRTADSAGGGKQGGGKGGGRQGAEEAGGAAQASPARSAGFIPD